jgi:hypothetical protein
MVRRLKPMRQGGNFEQYQNLRTLQLFGGSSAEMEMPRRRTLAGLNVDERGLDGKGR